MTNDIPPRDFGKLEATVEQLEDRLEKTVLHFEGRMEKLTHAVEELTNALNQAKGGWKMLAGVASASAILTAMILKFMGFLKGI
jgi:hypothetical protein